MHMHMHEGDDDDHIIYLSIGYSLCVEDNLRICRSLPYHHHLLRVWQWIDRELHT